MGGRCKEEKEVRDEAADFSFFLNWPSPASFMFIFSLFETDNMNFYNKNVSLVLVLGFELITY